MPKLTIPKENVIGLAQEPIPFLSLNDEFIKYAQKHIGKYYVSDKCNLPEPFIEGNSFLCYARPILDTYKPKLMSIMVSQKMYAPGHIYRHELVKKILQTNLPIDIWGRGCYHYKDSRIKGTFPIYLGCNNNPFSDQTIHLTGDIEKDIHLLVMICQNPNHYRRTININKVEDHVNIMKNMKTLF